MPRIVASVPAGAFQTPRLESIRAIKTGDRAARIDVSVKPLEEIASRGQ